MKRLVAALIPLLLSVSSGSASAIDLPVNYLVDGKELTSLAPAGTNITFELFSDAACTASVFTTTVDIDTVSLGIEKLKLASVKGSAKPPKPVRINAVLAGVTPSSQLYLTVTGTGITPVNGACQVQVSGVPGAAGPAGPSGISNCSWVTGSSASLGANTGEFATAVASCAPGDLVFSGGCSGSNSIAITSSLAASPSSWSCQFLRVFADPFSPSVSARALCCTP
jgi:hypothetical protein